MNLMATDDLAESIDDEERREEDVMMKKKETELQSTCEWAC